jgi:hypothetical protein
VSSKSESPEQSGVPSERPTVVVRFRGDDLHLIKVPDTKLLEDPVTGQRYVQSPLTGTLIPCGAHPWNTGGKKGRSGRRPDAFKEMCQKFLQDPATAARLGEIMHTGSDDVALRAIMGAAQYVAPKQAEEKVGKVQVFIGMAPMGMELIPEGEWQEIDEPDRLKSGDGEDIIYEVKDGEE